MKTINRSFSFLFLLTVLLVSGCQSLLTQDSDSSSQVANQSAREKPITTVDVGIATAENSDNSREYTGTTEPNSTTILRSKVTGRLLNLTVAVGDRVTKNRVIGRLDDSLLAATVEQERAELASLESELMREKLGIKNAQIGLEESKINLEQAENDAQRYSGLAKIGAISQQQAESFQTAAKVARQAVFSAEEEIKIARQAVTTAMGRVSAQKAAIAEVAQRQAYSQLVAPATGIVVSKNNEPGDLIREGEEILSLGDFSEIKIVVPISASDLNLVSLGQVVEIEFDAISDRFFPGKVTKIAPVANPETRKITIEVSVLNNNNEIKSGLLAKVQFKGNKQQQIAIPRSAIIQESGIDYIFAIDEEDKEQSQATVIKRKIKTSSSSQDKVFVTEGLKIGEKYILRSSKPLSDKETVKLSILSPI